MFPNSMKDIAVFFDPQELGGMARDLILAIPVRIGLF